jgi:hypothetical protein
MREIFKSTEKKYHTDNLVLKVSLPSIIFLIFIFLGIHNLNSNTNPEDADTTGYLLEANLIKKNGGITNFLNLCINGKYKQANQHPLYILMISTFASRNITFFIFSKIASLIMGLILLIILYIIVNKKYGNICASIAVLGLTLNPVFLKWTTLVASESLLMVLSLLCIYFIISGFKNGKYWSYAGIFAGFAYFAKGTGLFLVPGFLMVALFQCRSKIFVNKYIYIFLVLFVLSASPLLIRNFVVYENPFFNINTKIFISSNYKESNFLYSFSNPDIGSNVYAFSAVETDKEIKESSSKDVFGLIKSLTKKIINGIPTEISVLLKTLHILPFNKFPYFMKLILYSILILLFFIGILREKDIYEKFYIIITLIIFIVCLSMFRPITRYFLPVLPVIWIYIAFGILTLFYFFYRTVLYKFIKFDFISLCSICILSFCIFIFGWFIVNKNISNPFHSVEYSDSRYDLLYWLRNNLEANDMYCEGPNFNWQLDKGTWVQAPKDSRTSMLKFNSFLKKHSVKFIIVDLYSLTVSRFRGGGIDRMKKFEDYFYIDSLKGIVQTKDVNNWELVYKDPRRKVRFMVFKTNYAV